MKLPRDIDGIALVRALAVLEYEQTRQKGSHIRITTHRDGENHEVIPHHPLASILKRIAAHHRITTDQLLRLLDL